MHISHVDCVAIVIHWVRQIEEVLSTQSAMHTADDACPLDEIEFWLNRCDDLSGISAQLDEPSVHNIVRILQAAKSSYCGLFNSLAAQLKVRELLYNIKVAFAGG